MVMPEGYDVVSVSELYSTSPRVGDRNAPTLLSSDGHSTFQRFSLFTRLLWFVPSETYLDSTIDALPDTILPASSLTIFCTLINAKVSDSQLLMG